MAPQTKEEEKPKKKEKKKQTTENITTNSSNESSMSERMENFRKERETKNLNERVIALVAAK